MRSNGLCIRVEPTSRAEFRVWLKDNSDSSAGIWLAVGKKGNRVTTLTYDDAVQEGLCFGWIDSTVRRLDADRQRKAARNPSPPHCREGRDGGRGSRYALMKAPAFRLPIGSTQQRPRNRGSRPASPRSRL